MTGMPREEADYGEKIQVIFQGVSHEINVTADIASCFVEIGPAPDAQTVGQRFRLPPDTPEYIAVNPGVDKIAAFTGILGGVMPVPVGPDTTVIRLLYAAAEGVLEIMEGANAPV